jgi:hypothetical protein
MGTKRWMGVAIIMSLWAANLAAAADWSVVPSITQRSEFNSNLNLDFTNPKKDGIFTLMPAADFNYTTEVNQLQGHIGLTPLVYISQSQLDHIDQNYQINGQYAVTPRVNFTLNTAYINDSSLLQEYLASGAIMTRTPRQSILANPGINYNLTERLNTGLSYSFNRVTYQNPQFRDYSTHYAGLNFKYLLRNEKTTLLSNITGTDSLYPGGDHYQNLGFYLGANHKFTERWELNFLGGVNVGFSSFATQVVATAPAPYFTLVNTKRLNQTNVTPYVNLFATRRWTNLTITGGLTADTSPTAYGSIDQYYRAYLGMNYDFTERLAGALSGGFTYSTQISNPSSNPYENNYFNINPQLSYRLTEQMSLSPGYNFTTRSDLTPTYRNAHAHMAYMMFTYTYPIHYQR